MREFTESVRQLDTHRKLVSQTEQRELDLDTRLTLDAVIVPASRPAENLDQAISLARATNCALLILCSHQGVPAEVHKLLAEQSFNDAIVVDLPDDYRHELLDFRALTSIKDDLPAACSYYVTDLSTKRNVALILARMLGWQRIFFLDDDIRDVEPADVSSVVSLLGSYATAGMRVIDYPDNSAACHANRMTGGLQDVFVTGAALAVDCQQNTGFFPDIYNEDWLFFYDVASAGQLGSSRRRVRQLHYDPFADPERAAWQEFGDVLAEGLYALLDHRQGVQHATREYWFNFRQARQRFLEAIIGRSGAAEPEIRTQLLCSVEAALKCSAEIPPELFERYIRLWRQDLHDWRERVAGIRKMPSPEAALQALGLPPSADSWVADVARHGSAAATEEASTMPFTVPDYYVRFTLGTDDEGSTAPGWGKRGELNRRADSLDQGSLRIREGGLLASARRFLRIPEREYAPAESSPAPDAQPAEPALSYEASA
jgi:hypothetical protein